MSAIDRNSNSNSNTNNSDVSTPPPANIINRNNQFHNHNFKQKPPVDKQDIEIHSMYQLTRLEKEKVKVLYRAATIRGFRMDQITEYIYIKSKLNVTYGFVKTLKQMQYEDDGQFFYKLARDHHAYLSIYRLAIDKLDELEKEMWLIIMNPKIDPAVRIQATKEIHAITKTSVLLMRDLPFITNLSRFYDLSVLDPKNEGIGRLPYAKQEINNNRSEITRQHMTKDIFDGANSSLVHNILDNLKDTKRIDAVTTNSSGNKLVDSDVMDEMQKQILDLGYDTDPEVKAKKAAERKKIDDAYIEKNLAKLDAELSQVTSEDEAKVVKAAQDYRKTMNYLDQIIPKEHRDAISRIRETTTEENDDNNR